MQTKASRFIVSGRVQGVGYRDFAQRAARQLELVGHARNLADGTVEVYAAGAPEKLEELRTLLAQGPRASDVRNIERMEAEMLHYEGFSIKH